MTYIKHDVDSVTYYDDRGRAIGRGRAMPKSRRQQSIEKVAQEAERKQRLRKGGNWK